MLGKLHNAFERLLEAIVIFLMTVLAVLVMVGVVYRAAGAALSWYDELASILLCWLTYFGAALAALKRAHIGVPGIVLMMPRGWRVASFFVAEALVFAFFVLLAQVGWNVIEVLQGDYLVSMPEVPVALAQSIIPIGAVLFILAEAISLPQAWRATMAKPASHEPGADALVATE